MPCFDQSVARQVGFLFVKNLDAILDFIDDGCLQLIKKLRLVVACHPTETCC